MTPLALVVATGDALNDRRRPIAKLMVCAATVW